MDKKIKKKDPSFSLSERVMHDILNLDIQLNKICDNKANYLLGISSIIITLSLSKISGFDNSIHPAQKWGFIIMCLAALISAIISVDVLKPKIGKNFKKLNLFYYANFLEKLSREEYVKQIRHLLNDKNMIEDQYASEIYDFAYYDLSSRFKKIKLATEVLLGGLVISVILIILSTSF